MTESQLVPSCAGRAVLAIGALRRALQSASVRARIAVALTALWLLTGALAKLFYGNPKILPELVRDHSPFDWDLTFHLAIAIELSIVALAVLKPHLGWAALAGLFAFFEVVLVSQLLAGAESCGCLGDTIKFPPALMMAIDGALLAGMLWTRPWRALGGPGLSTLVLVAALAVSWGAPWLAIRTAPSGGAGQGDVAGVRYAILYPPGWVGRAIYDIGELKRWVPEEKLPIEGSVVFFRQSCPHCAVHLREMAAHDDGTRQILLIQARDDLKNAPEVDALPQGDHVTLIQMPENLECAFTTPCEVRVANGMVSAALYAEDLLKEREKAGG